MVDRLRGDQREDQTRLRDRPMWDLRQTLEFDPLPSGVAMVLEDLLRQMVREEVERSIGLIPRDLERQSQMQIPSSPEIPLYQLIFKNQPKTPIFAGARIQDHEGSPLQIQLVVGPTRSPCSSPSPIKIELVVLDGDFPSHDDWTSEEFEKALVKERTGRRPLLSGDVSNITMRDGSTTIGDLQFTDNSSWIRNRHFRIGVRVMPGINDRTFIKESMTEKFTVKDHRGELCRKHYPPVLTDEVWRLEKIGKNGTSHKKLSESNIHNIQDFLKLHSVDPGQLRHILNGVKDRNWERVINHASKCDLGDKIYCYSGQNAVKIFLNSICQVVQITIDGFPHTIEELPKNYRDYVRQLVREAYQQWNNLREADDVDANVALIQSQNLVQTEAGQVQWYQNSSQDSGIIEFKGEADEGSSSNSFQFDGVSSMEWSHEFNQMP
ncbi:hypothetical protein LUZ62_030745 [Rhynchospora pubera]|uniref:Calmodulin-binding protein n=1 Tax=Rhynchospora pubera TaxID=906938 RepID=A0AAV8HKF6_9POAL|nr:hypothetical protein LUZ62_030745 [Rhynchospora pubera]